MARNTKMPRTLVALSASAVAAVYLAGFGITQGADASLGQAAATTPPAITTTTSVAQAASPIVSVAPAASAQQASPASPTASASPTAAPPTSTPSTAAAGTSATPTASGSTSSSTTTSAYQDGTYTGSGTSRRGGISVSVTIQGGRIANVQITGSSTEYPVSRISSLPAQVVSKQSAQVNNVSGATYSAQAFQLAVQQALSKAKA